ncbi:hypothetical protein ABPG72_022807 [Tetrahymena utriculariae]
MEGSKCGKEHFTYKNETQMKERDPLLNKFILDTFAYSALGAVAGFTAGIFLKRPTFWSVFFSGVGAHYAYSTGPVKFRYWC